LKKHYFLFLCTLFFINSLFAQTHLLSGVVTDSLKVPLAFANVLVKPDSFDVDMAFAITDQQGRYKLNL